jgi:hypothetical protein
MELPTTIRDLFVLLFAPGGLGAVFSWLESNWAWFAKLESGQKALFISVLTAVFGAVYYFITQQIDPSWFSRFDKFYASFAPFLAFIIGQWVMHSTVNKAREKENASG